jgi:hypothetical protein
MISFKKWQSDAAIGCVGNSLRDPDAWVALASPDGTEDGSSQA